MKLGLSTWSLLGLDVYSAVDLLDQAGVEYVELWGEYPHAYPGWADEKRLRDALSTSKMTVTAHAPFTDLNPATPDPHVRDAVQKVLERFVHFSADLGATMVTVHPGSVHSKLLKGGSAAAAAGTIGRMVKAAGGRLTINIENQTRGDSKYHHPLGSDLESLLALLSQVEGAKCTLDTGHAFVSGQDPLAMAEGLGAKLAELHLSDNSGKSDEHLIPGEGRAPLAGLMERAGKTDALICLELNPHIYGKDEVIGGFERTKRMFGRGPTYENPGNI